MRLLESELIKVDVNPRRIECGRDGARRHVYGSLEEEEEEEESNSINLKR